MPAPVSTPPAPTAGTSTARVNVTRPENLGSSAKRAQRGPSLYQNLLPITPPPPSFLASFASRLPGLNLTAPQIEAIYDELTRTVWVRGEDEMVLLWRRGFFGKGALSRSDPSWRQRVQNKRATVDGVEKKLTSEEVTALRRAERKTTKQAKKLEREAEKLLAANAAQASQQTSRASSPAPPTPAALPTLAAVEEAATDAAVVEQDPVASTSTAPAPAEQATQAIEEEVPPAWQLEAEHLQLQPEEAFFLLFALGALSVRRRDPLALEQEAAPSAPLSILSAFNLFLLDGYTLPLLPPSPTTDSALALSSPVAIDPRLSRWDSPFLVSYASYHHFRSMGWVVRSGVKFCTEWVLYGPGGPVGGHAEFAVVVVPNYADPRDGESSPFRTHWSRDGQAEGESKDSWRWFHTINRVCGGVKKTLVLLHVLIPAMATLPSADWIATHPAQALARFEMREVTVRRWSAGRMRD